MSLSVNSLRVYYRSLAGDVKALDGVTFSLADGEIMGLAGESGCGKSTLAKSLVRFDSRMRYVSGDVVLDGKEVPIADHEAMREFRLREISIIPQYAMSALNPTRKIGRLTADVLEARGERYDALRPELGRRLELVGLDASILDRYPMELSGGMKQRAVIVISTLLNPSLLIADEITSALDVSTQRAVVETLVDFRNRGFVKSMIMITHDLSILYQMADSITVMYAGKLAEKAATPLIIGDPLHPYTRLLVSSLPDVGVKFDETPLAGIPGSPPPLLRPPTGCRFRPRCPVAMADCTSEPAWTEPAPGRSVACWVA